MSSPFSKNIIFIDAEFTKLSAKGTKFLSIALIEARSHLSRPCDSAGIPDRELYLEIEVPDGEDIDPWVQENVAPHMTEEKVTPEMAVEKIRGFVGDTRPFMVADVPAFDWMGICGMFGVFDVPFHYIPIDFASILFSNGIDPDIDRERLSMSLGVEFQGEKHNALSDCRNLKNLYINLIERIEK